MSLTRISKSGGTHFSCGDSRQVRSQSRDKTIKLAPGGGTDKNKPAQNQMTPQTWATKIKDITYRLSRPTISSSLKRVDSQSTRQGFERNSQFWNTMAYCSNEHQKKFCMQGTPVTKNRPVPDISSQPNRINGPLKRFHPGMCATSQGNKSCCTLPSLTKQRASDYRS